MSRPYAHMSHPYLWGIPDIRTLPNMYHNRVIDIISRPCTHAFLPYLKGICAYIHSKTLHQYDSHITTNSFNVILWSYVYTKRSVPLRNACITSTSNICHLMKSTQRQYSVTLAYMTFQTFGEFM
jgi:hypothetical protein